MMEFLVFLAGLLVAVPLAVLCFMYLASCLVCVGLLNVKNIPLRWVLVLVCVIVTPFIFMPIGVMTAYFCEYGFGLK